MLCCVLQGSLPDKIAAEFETARLGLEKLQAALATLADILDRDLPELPAVVEEEETDGTHTVCKDTLNDTTSAHGIVHIHTHRAQ